MQIKLLVARASAAGSQARGEIIEVSDAEAVRMIEAGQAEAVRGIKAERAVRKPKVERATK